jgi:hypothetical protein
MSAQTAFEILSEQVTRLNKANAQLRQTLKDLVGLAEMRGGHLHEYQAAIASAHQVLRETA